MIFTANFSLSFFLFAFLLWLLLWGSRKILLRWMQGKKSHKINTFYFPIVQSVFWILFASCAIFQFTKLNPLITLILVGALLFLGRRFLQNLFVGILFRMEKGDLRGVPLAIDTKEGSIISYELTTVCLKSADGNLSYIPYEKLYKESFVRIMRVSQSSDIQSLKIDLDKGEVITQEFLDAIRKKVLLNPYIAGRENVQVTQGKDEIGKWILLNYKLLNPEQANYVKQELQKAIFAMKTL